MEQPSIMLEAIELMESFYSTISAKDAKPYNDDGEIDYITINRMREEEWDKKLGING